MNRGEETEQLGLERASNATKASPERRPYTTAADNSLFVVLVFVLTVPTNPSGRAKKASLGVAGTVATGAGPPRPLVAVGLGEAAGVAVGMEVGAMLSRTRRVGKPLVGTNCVAVGCGVDEGNGLAVAVAVGGAAAPKERNRELPGGTDLMRLKVSPVVRRKRNSMFWGEVVGLLTERPETTPTRLN